MPEQLEATPHITPESVAEKRAVVAQHFVDAELSILTDNVVDERAGRDESGEGRISVDPVSAVVQAMRSMPKSGGMSRVPGSER